MSSQPYSLALEQDEMAFDRQTEVPLSLVVNKCYGLEVSSLKFDVVSQDIVELGGTITVSF